MHNIVKKLLGAALIILGAMLVISCALYNPSDPSFNVATDATPKHLLGLFGSYTADLLVQWLGYSHYLISLSLIYWGRELWREKPLKHFTLKLSALVIGTVFLAILLGGFGGALGAATSSLLSSVSVMYWYFCLLALTLCLTAIVYNSDFVAAKPPEPVLAQTKPAPPSRKVKDTPPSRHKKVVHVETNGMLPSINLLHDHEQQNYRVETREQLDQKACELLNTLGDFGVKGKIISINQGPVVTLYEFEPAAGTKSSRVIGLAGDIARSLSAISARISTIAGRNALGIELPNEHRQFFGIKELLQTEQYLDNRLLLPIVLGKDISGEPFVVDLAKMPHLLIAGTTGSGKSVGINTMILSLLYRYTAEECKLIMIDPKMLELSVYDDIPHLMTPVVTEASKAVVALKWAVKEMERRYRLMSQWGVRNITGYNSRVDSFNAPEEEEETPTKLPFIVVIVDEMADLMLVAGKEIEGLIQRLAQMARAAGIHLIMATQRPSVDVITGVIKANFPSRVSFKVTSKIDSRTILGDMGAEQLLGAGDMLYMGSAAKITRIHGPFVRDSEVEEVVNFLKEQGEPEYVTSVTELEEQEDPLGIATDQSVDDDHLYKEAIQIVKRDKKCSTSYIQRCLRIGYNRAAIIVERMEREGVVSTPNHSGKREILIQ